MLSRETTAGIACSFLMAYYREFVKERELTGLLDLYSDASQLTYANYNEETPDLAQGRGEIAQHFAKLDAALGRRKMEVFVLAPTQHRTNTYHIASDYFRVMTIEVEHIPEDSIVMTPAEVAQHLLQDHERRQRAEEKRERLRQQQVAAEALWQRQRQAEEAEAEQRRELQSTRNNEQELRRGRGERSNNGNSSNYNNNNNNRREYVDQNDDRRGEQGGVRRFDRTERSDNNRSERGEWSGNKHEHRNEKKIERRGDRRERQINKTVGNNGGVKTQEDITTVTAAPRSTRTFDSREKPNAAPTTTEGTNSNKNNNNNINNNRPVPRSKAALEKQNVKMEEAEDRGGSNAKKQRAAVAAPLPTTATATTTTGEERKPLKQRNVGERTCNTDFVRFIRVPKTVKLSDIKEAVTSVLGAEPLDAYWFGRSSADCVLKLKSPAAVEQMVRSTVTVLDVRLTAVQFYP